jgi:hypothetical protein
MAYYSFSSTSHAVYIHLFPAYLISLSEAQSPKTLDQEEGRFKDIATYTVARGPNFHGGGGGEAKKLHIFQFLYVKHILYVNCYNIYSFKSGLRVGMSAPLPIFISLG